MFRLHQVIKGSPCQDVLWQKARRALTGGHQTRQYIRINLLDPRACAATSGMEAIGYSEPRDERGRKLLRTLSRGV